MFKFMEYRKLYEKAKEENSMLQAALKNSNSAYERAIADIRNLKEQISAMLYISNNPTEIKKELDDLFRGYCGGEYCSEESCKDCEWLGRLGDVYKILERKHI